MPPTDPGTLRAALTWAARAPSVHNSQPWRWRVGEDAVELHADLSRWLQHADADGRDMLLSCGAALHHLVVALSALGRRATVTRLPDPARPEVLASVRVPATERGAPGDAIDTAAAISTRRTDRRRYGDWPVLERQLDELRARAAACGAALRTVGDGAPRRALADAFRTAALAHAAEDGYDLELALWSGHTAAEDGVPAANVPPPPAPGAGIPGRRFAGADLPPADPGPDGATLLVLGTSSDDRLARLRAGEALSAVLLHATTLGMATCPLTEPLEVADTATAVRDLVLDGTLSPQAVLRIGWPVATDPPPATPRRPLLDQVDGLDHLRP
ncbi:Acg family FMN-binding oxidoreductase [Pseudonocardia spirodelae]|uniref:NAD(P)H nitroreductase n=1 Tax=Pseudonocardia spirodelae TaxID=3133431 RepID=A0ABU8T2I6_9PSEU